MQARQPMEALDCMSFFKYLFIFICSILITLHSTSHSRALMQNENGSYHCFRCAEHGSWKDLQKQTLGGQAESTSTSTTRNNVGTGSSGSASAVVRSSGFNSGTATAGQGSAFRYDSSSYGIQGETYNVGNTSPSADSETTLVRAHHHYAAYSGPETAAGVTTVNSAPSPFPFSLAKSEPCV